jgi:hypothetical protein
MKLTTVQKLIIVTTAAIAALIFGWAMQTPHAHAGLLSSPGKEASEEDDKLGQSIPQRSDRGDYGPVTPSSTKSADMWSCDDQCRAERTAAARAYGRRQRMSQCDKMPTTIGVLLCRLDN